MHKNITREIYPLPKNNLDFSLVSPTTRDDGRKRERERAPPVVALSWSLFAPHHRVFSLCVFFLVHFWSLKKDRAFVVNIFPFQR